MKSGKQYSKATFYELKKKYEEYNSDLQKYIAHANTEKMSGDEVSLSLRVVGQRGIMAQDIDMSITQVAGAVSQPLAAPMPAWRARTLRLSLTGEARTGTLLMKTLIYSHQ